MLKERLRRRMLKETTLAQTGATGERELVKAGIERFLREEKVLLPARERKILIEELVNEITGLGPLQPLLEDADITEVMVNKFDEVYIERKGRLDLTGVRFESESQLYHTIERIISPLGLRIDESSPMVDGRLPDGSRVNAIIPPLSLKGPVLTIRKFSTVPLTMEDLVEEGTLPGDLARFLAGAVKAKSNIVVSGGTGSGKTTFLNVLSSFIPAGERLITIEDAAELRFNQPHVISLESRPPNIEGQGEVTIRDLVRNALRMRPDRIIVGEVRGGEALDMLQAMNTGHEGSLTTAHANSCEDLLRRLETMVLMSDVNLPVGPVREQIASAIDLIVQTARLTDGLRKVVEIARVSSFEDGEIKLTRLYEFQRERQCQS